MSEAIAAQVGYLKRLSSLDSNILNIEATKQEKETSIHACTEDITQLDATIENESHQQKLLEHKEREKESLLKGLEQRIHEVSLKLNAASDNKEYAILLAKKESLAAQCARLEDEILNILANMEALKTKLEEMQIRAKKEKNEIENVIKSTKDEVAELDSQIQQLKKERETISKNISFENLARYDKVFKRGHRPVVVPVKDGICQGCFMRIPPQQIDLILMEDAIIPCKNCNRILYLEDPDAERG